MTRWQRFKRWAWYRNDLALWRKRQRDRNRGVLGYWVDPEPQRPDKCS